MKKQLLVLAACLGLISMAILLTGCQSTNLTQTPAGQRLVGKWAVGGPYQTGKVCRIQEVKGSFQITDALGNTTAADMVDENTIVAKEWQGGLVGSVSEDGNRINWQDGTWWKRVGK